MPASVEASRSSRAFAYLPPLIAFAVFIAFVSQISDFYLSRLAALLAFWAALGMSWNLIGGYAGQLSLGHAAFVGLGGTSRSYCNSNSALYPGSGCSLPRSQRLLPLSS